MENLIAYLYKKHINSEEKNLGKLSKQQPIKVHTLAEEELQSYSPVLVRNFLTYSPANLEMRLSLQNLLVFHRLHKFEAIMIEQGLEYFFKEWVQNEFFPIMVPSTRKIPPNASFIFIDEAQGEQKGPLKRKKSKDSIKSKEKPKQGGKGLKTVMINVKELTKELQNRILCKWLEQEPQNLKRQEDRLLAKQKMSQNRETAQWQKIEEYVNQKYCQDTLMVFNFIFKYPLMDEKQLLTRTMLPVIELRKCINNLIAEGLVNFYAQNSRTMLFRAIKKSRILELYQDHMAQCYLNLLVFMQNESDKEKQAIIRKSLSKIDDILLVLAP